MKITKGKKIQFLKYLVSFHSCSHPQIKKTYFNK